MQRKQCNPSLLIWQRFKFLTVFQVSKVALCDVTGESDSKQQPSITSRPPFLDSRSAFFVGGYKQGVNVLRKDVTHELKHFIFSQESRMAFVDIDRLCLPVAAQWTQHNTVLMTSEWHSKQVSHKQCKALLPFSIDTKQFSRTQGHRCTSDSKWFHSIQSDSRSWLYWCRIEVQELEQKQFFKKEPARFGGT